jgi:hypothetical protein
VIGNVKSNPGSGQEDDVGRSVGLALAHESQSAMRQTLTPSSCQAPATFTPEPNRTTLSRSLGCAPKSLLHQVRYVGLTGMDQHEVRHSPR